ncbi:hypothetical protein HDU91_001689 [Kappamyces sp. JEL0680]|nr:hypothetical protein HDU91_001689 [Kappamyces sp. JEL0680]
MTIMSAAMGQILPQLISKNYTEILAAVLFLVFGLKLGFDSFKLTGNECLEELEEVTAELVVEDQRKLEENEAGATTSTSYRSPYWKLCGISPVWIQVFVMTFLAEWGDRSQIASRPAALTVAVALAGSQDFLYVTIGGLLGHAICSGVAVDGTIAEADAQLATRISVKTVSLAGAALFVLFGIIGLYQALTEYRD